LCGHRIRSQHFLLQGCTGYFRSDSLRAYFRRTLNCEDKEYLLYDFSMDIGDTAYVGFELWGSWQPEDTAGFKLISIDTITQFGVSRRRFNMLSWFSFLWHQRITTGQWHGLREWVRITTPSIPFLCLWDGCESWYTTLCFDSAGTQLYQHPDFGTCSATSVGIDEVQSNLNITISPNPFTHSFRIDSDARIRDVEVYSILGEMIGRFEGKEDAMVVELPQHLSAGMYVVRIRTRPRHTCPKRCSRLRPDLHRTPTRRANCANTSIKVTHASIFAVQTRWLMRIFVALQIQQHPTMNKLLLPCYLFFSLRPAAQKKRRPHFTHRHRATPKRFDYAVDASGMFHPDLADEDFYGHARRSMGQMIADVLSGKLQGLRPNGRSPPD
jgi:hypothetical protein